MSNSRFGLRTRNGSIRNFVEGSVALGAYLLSDVPNAVGAYSLRKLNPNYSGNAIRVRRSSDSLEQNIGFNGLDLDTTSLTSFVGGDSGFITSWYDQSGNGHDCIQGTQTYQPKIINVGSLITEGGKSTILFDGVDDHLINGSMPASSTKTAVFIKKGVIGTGNSALIYFPATGGGLGIYFWNESPSKYGFNSWNADSWGISPSVTYTSRTVELALINNGLFNTSGVRYFINGGELTLSQVKGTSISRNMTTGFNIGVGGSFGLNQEYDGSFQEIIVYSSDKTSDLNTFNTNINGYYSIY